MGRVPASSQVFIEAIERPHVFSANGEIEDIGIFDYPFSIRRLWNHHHLMLQCPADQDLRRRFAAITLG
jgi:hypothetical protein